MSVAQEATAGELGKLLSLSSGSRADDLRSLFRMTPDLLCIATDGGFVLEVNPAALRLRRPEEIAGAHLTELLHPADRGGVRRALESLVRREGETVEIEARSSLQDGSWRWISWTFTAAPSADRLYAVGRDVTDAVKLERSLRQTASRFSALIGAAQAGVVVEDAQCRLVLVNASFRRMFDLHRSDDELIGRPTREALDETLALFDDPGAFLEEIERLVTARRRTLSEEIFLLNGRILERDYLPIHTEEGYQGHFWVFRDITAHRHARDELENMVNELKWKNHELERLRRSLREQVVRDFLTGLHNRRFLDQSFEPALREAARTGRPLSVLALDLDRFKNINDRHGHAVGDRLLKVVGDLLRERLRPGDLMVRQGGDELVVLLPETSLPKAVGVAEDLRRGIASATARVDGLGGRGVTVSVGVAEHPAHGERPEALLTAADAALYRAKKEGRDRVVTAEVVAETLREAG